MTLAKDATRHWGHVQSVIDYIAKLIPPEARVLEVGPGNAPLARANAYVDFVDIPGLENLTKHDLSNGPLPFADKEFDFVYARHMIEDMFNPFALCKEMSRVGKAGYIETPSPIAELCRGVDGGGPPFRGYHHHRYFAWVSNGELWMVSKYPFMEYLRFNEPMIEKLLETQRYWNTYYLWNDEINVNHRQSPLHFSIPKDYAAMLTEAVDTSKRETDKFFEKV